MANTVPSSASDHRAKAYHSVFIDTNLDTHFALLVAESDTVVDLKQKIMLEHPRCFPTIGKVKVHTVQVKRKEFFYHLSDSMFIETAFGGAKKSWLIYVHLVKPDDCNNLLALPWVTDRPSNSGHDTPFGKSFKRLSHHHDSSLLQPGLGVPSFEQVNQGGSFGESPKYVGAGDLYTRDGHCKTGYSDYNKRSELEEKYDVARERMASKKRIRDLQHDILLEAASESRPAAKKKRKTERNESSGKIFKKDGVAISKVNNVTSNGPCSTSSNVVREPESGIVKGISVAPLLVFDSDVREKAGSSKYEAVEKEDNEELIKEPKKASGSKRKKVTENSCAARNEDESVVKNANIVPSAQEKEAMLSYAGKKETLERELIEESHGPVGRSVDNFIRGEADILQATEVNRSQDGENVKEKSKECENIGHNMKEKKKKKKKASGFAARDGDTSAMEHANDVVIDTTSTVPKSSSKCYLIQKQMKDKSTLFDTERKEIPVEKSQGPTVHIENLVVDEADILQATKANRSQEHGKDVKEKSMVCEHIGKKKKKKTRKVAARHEDASDHANDAMIDTTSTVPKPSSDGHLNQKQEKDRSTLFDTERKEMPVEKLINASLEVVDREISEKKSTEESQGAAGRDIETNLIRDEADILQVTEANRSQEHGEDVDERSKVCESIGQSMKTKKRTRKKSARDADAPVVDHANDKSSLFDTERKKIPAEKSINASHVVSGREGALLGNEAEIFLPNEAKERHEKVNENDQVGVSEYGVGTIGSVKHVVAEKEFETTGETRRKNRKKVNKSAAINEVASVVEHANDAVLEKDEGILCHTKKTERPEGKSADNSHTVPDRKRDGVTGNEADTLQPGEPKIVQENVSEKSRSRGRGKKSKNSTKSVHGFLTDEHELDVAHSHLNQDEKTKEHTSITDNELDKKTTQNQWSVKDHADLPGKGEVDLQDFTSTSANIKGIHKQASVDNTSRTTKITCPGKSKTSQLEPERSQDTQHVSFLPEKTSKDICMFEVPPSLVLDNVADANTDDQVDVLNHGRDGIDFKRYFMADQHQNEYSLTNKAKDVKQLARLSKAENTNRHAVPSKTLQEVSGDEMKAPNSHHIDQIETPQKARQPDILTASRANRSPPASRGNNGFLVGPSSGSESSVRSRRKMVKNVVELTSGQSGAGAVGKFSSKSTGEVVNVSQHGKSLLATPGAIFGDGSSNSSADDNGNVNSDASTRTPSDKSLSSESEGESESTLDSGRNGSYAAKRKSGRNYLVDSQSSDVKNKTIEEILRSSTRFKKAKLAASQLLKDTDSEAVEFVPDSQANP